MATDKRRGEHPHLMRSSHAHWYVSCPASPGAAGLAQRSQLMLAAGTGTALKRRRYRIGADQMDLARPRSENGSWDPRSRRRRSGECRRG